jgi:putative ABC transport system permease protein
LLPKGLVPALQPPITVNPSERTPLLMLLGAVGLVLAVACVNVMSLALAQGTMRRRELAICAALGASRWRLLRQLLAENLLVAALGGLAGTTLAYAAVTSLAPQIPSALTFLSMHAIRVDRRALVFTLSATVVSALVAGLLPAFRASRCDVIESLKSTGQGLSTSTNARRVLRATAAAQCSLALVLLVGAALLVRSFFVLQAVDPGFDTRNLAIVQTQLPRHRYPDAVSQMAFNNRVLQQFRAVPGVTAVTLSGGAPPTGGAISFGYFETDTGTVLTTDFEMPHMPVAPEYFQVMGIPLVAGRGFEPGDAAQTAIINDVFATRYWGTIADALGRRFRLGPNEPWSFVVGVSRDIKAMGLDDHFGDGMEFYSPWDASGRGWGTYFYTVRTDAAVDRVLPLLRERFWALDPRAPILNASDSRSYLMTSIERPRFFALLLTIFAALSATVAAIGIHSAFAYVVAQRRHEVGIRLALGATRGQMLRLILRDSLVVATAGMLVGQAGAWMLSRTLQALLFQIAPGDPIALGAASLCLLLVVGVASYAPARRAARVDPLQLLKVE